VGQDYIRLGLVVDLLKERLTDENFLVYCAKVYDNPGMQSTEEFLEDVKRIGYIKKLLTKYEDTSELKEKLILNHIITLHNCFGNHLAKILFLKIEKQYHCIKPFLILLNALPHVIYNVGKYTRVVTDEISLDQNIVETLRGIRNA
jgi:hypothetical protein